MSSRDWTFRIQDILTSIEKIESYIKGMTFREFKKNTLVMQSFVISRLSEKPVNTFQQAFEINILKFHGQK